jgi:hypothetical protein
MQKMILGLFLSALGGAGFIISMREILGVAEHTSELGWGTIYESSIDFSVIVVLISVILFIAGMILVLTDDDVRML